MTKWGLMALLGAILCVMPAVALAAYPGAAKPRCQAGDVASQVRAHVRRDHRWVWVERWRCVAVTPATTQTTPTLTQAQTSANGNSTCPLDSTGCYDLVSATIHYPVSLLPLVLGTP